MLRVRVPALFIVEIEVNKHYFGARFHVPNEQASPRTARDNFSQSSYEGGRFVWNSGSSADLNAWNRASLIALKPGGVGDDLCIRVFTVVAIAVTSWVYGYLDHW